MADTIKDRNMNGWGYLTTISIVALVIIAVVAMALMLVPDVVSTLVKFTLYAGVIGLAAFLTITLGIGAATGWERWQTSRAQRRAIENDAALTVIDAPADHRVWTFEPDTGVYHNLTLDPRHKFDGINGPAPTETELRAWAFYHQAINPAPRVVGNEAAMLPEPEPAIDILSVLERTQRGLIVGPSDAGKSTVLRWFADIQSRKSDVIVIDPHAYQGKWPGCIVVGRGRQYAMIDKALAELGAIMDDRYQKLSHSTDESCGEPPITLLVDEWTSINRQCTNASDMLIALLTESRKVAMRVYVNCHSDRVKSLGLDGQGDLRDGFEIYQLEVNQQTGEHRGWMEIRRKGQKPEITPLALPGPYRRESATEPANDIQSLRLLDVPPDMPLVPEPGSVDELVCHMKEEGASMRQITQAVFGGKFGDHWNQKVYAILDRYGVSR